jgi:hypothetical protein
MWPSIVSYVYIFRDQSQTFRSEIKQTKMSGWNNNNADQTVKKSSDNSQFKDEENISDFTGKFQSIGISGWDNNDTEFDRKMRAKIQEAKDDGNKSETTGTGGSSAPRESTAWYITELPKRP